MSMNVAVTECHQLAMASRKTWFGTQGWERDFSFIPLLTLTIASVKGLVIFLRKSKDDLDSEVGSVCQLERERSASVALSRYLQAISRGKSTITVSQLNISWTVAAANARRNSSLSETCIKETIVLVTDVPIFAPIIIGMAWRTWIKSEPTIVTTIDVDVDDDWTRTVTRTPIINPTIGFWSNVELDINLPAALLPIKRNEDERKFSEKINVYMSRQSEIGLSTVKPIQFELLMIN